MTTTFPGSPKVARGALVGIDLMAPVPSVIAFQYNPDTLQRSLQPQGAGTGGESDKAEALRLKGAPIETIKVEVEIDATDQLERDDAGTRRDGIYPQLSALEMLIYPKSSLVIANTILMAVGTIEVLPPTAPLTIFVWGPKRAVPVRVSELSITEEAYDENLNPIRAKVSLGLRVLSYSDLPLTNPGYALFLAHQIAKEVMGAQASAQGLADIAGGDLKLI